ncbi:hypothetical protein [Deinococcus hohokamensis]|uniref:Lipopolysaccharide assembly protein A domain-containing protein n=1 Tax=Deinococcus hohokamensis TaxID=309883 RepID=A0ABV9I4F2_9DEIO
MTRMLFALAGVVLLAITALAVVWLVGEILAGLGAFVVGASVVLWKLLWFLILAGVLGGLVFFVTSAWRPAPPATKRPAAPPAGAPRPETPAAPVPEVTERLVFTPDLPDRAIREEP